MNDTTSEEKYYIVETSDLSEMIGKSRFTTELSFFRCLGGSAKIIVNSEEHGLFLFPHLLPQQTQIESLGIRAEYISLRTFKRK